MNQHLLLVDSLRVGYHDLLGNDKQDMGNLFILNFRPNFTMPDSIAKDVHYEFFPLEPLSDDNSTALIEETFESDAIPGYEI